MDMDQLRDRLRRPIWLFVTAVALSCSISARHAFAQSMSAGAALSQEGDIRALIDIYATSIDTADTNLAALIWAKSAEVSFIHPLGWEHGFDQIRDNVYVRLMRETFSKRSLVIKDPAIHVYGDTAWAEFGWDFTAILRKDGASLKTEGRETQVYHKEPGGWRIVHVQYSGMPISGAGGF